MRDTRIVCLVCASTWPKHGTSRVYNNALVCPGIPPVQNDLFPGHANVPKTLLASGLHISAVKVDPSHTFAHINGITFCTKCGNYAAKIVRELANGCKMKVSNPTKSRHLKMLLKGRLLPRMDWPSPGANTPDYIRPYLA